MSNPKIFTIDLDSDSDDELAELCAIKTLNEASFEVQTFVKKCTPIKAEIESSVAGVPAIDSQAKPEGHVKEKVSKTVEETFETKKVCSEKSQSKENNQGTSTNVGNAKNNNDSSIEEESERKKSGNDANVRSKEAELRTKKFCRLCARKQNCCGEM